MDLTLLGRKMNKSIILFVMILSLNLLAQENSLIEFKNKSLSHIDLPNNYKINKTPELQFEEEERETKSAGKAFFYSLY